MDGFLDILLTGHVHEDDGRIEISAHGGFVHLAARPFTGDGEIDGFNILEIDPKTREGKAHFFRWSTRSTTFILDTEGPQQGSWSFPLPVRSVLSPQSTSIRTTAKSSLLRASEHRLDRHLPILTSSSGILSIRDRFIEPYLVQLVPGHEKKLPFRQILRDNASFVIEGGIQSGKSSILEFLSYEINQSSVAVVADFADADYSSPIDLVSATCDLSNTKARRLLEGAVTLLVDNAPVDLSSAVWERLQEWTVQSGGHLRIVATVRSAGIPIAVGKYLPGWKHGSLRPLPYSGVKNVLGQLAKRVGREKGPQIDKAILTLMEADLPRVPWVFPVLVELAANTDLGDVTSVSRLLRRYAEHRLRIAGAAPDSSSVNLLRDVLGHIAASLMDKRETQADRSETTNMLRVKLSASGVDEDPEQILDTLIKSRLIFQDDNGCVAFAFMSAQELFYAEHLLHERWSGAADLTTEAFVQLGGALSLFSEMVNAPEVLAKALSILNETRTGLGNALAMADFDDVEITFTDTADQAVEAARKSVPADAVLDDTLAHAERSASGAHAKRLQAKGSDLATQGAAAFWNAIVILRGSTWLERADKRSAVKQIVDHASVVLGTMLRDKSMLERIASAVFDKDKRRHITAVFATILVVVLGAMLAAVGGGSHLALTIGEMIQEETDEIRSILLTIWYAEVGGADLTVRIERLIKSASSLVTLQILEMWLRTHYVRTLTFAHADSEQIEGLLRLAVEERIRKSSSDRKKAFQIAEAVDKAIQTARTERTTNQVD